MTSLVPLRLVDVLQTNLCDRTRGLIQFTTVDLRLQFLKLKQITKNKYEYTGQQFDTLSPYQSVLGEIDFFFYITTIVVGKVCNVLQSSAI